jgi:hypothetical protein
MSVTADSKGVTTALCREKSEKLGSAENKDVSLCDGWAGVRISRLRVARRAIPSHSLSLCYPAHLSMKRSGWTNAGFQGEQAGVCPREVKEPSSLRLDGDIHGAGAKGTYEEPGEAADAVGGEEFEVIARGNVQIERLPIPGIVDAEAVAAWSNGNRDAAAVHESSDAFAIELHDYLAELGIFGRGSTDSDLRLRDLWRR